MIPRRFFYLIDSLVIVLAFELAYLLAPVFQSSTDRWVAFVFQFAPSWLPNLTPDSFTPTPVSQRAWMLLVAIPTMLLSLTITEAYDGPPRLSWTRSFLAGPFASLLGISAVALIIFTVRLQQQSRLVLLLLGTLSASGLSAIRILQLLYFRSQAEAGYYTRNVVLVGPSHLISPLSEFVRAHRLPGYYSLLGYVETEDPPQMMAVAASAHPRGAETLVYRDMVGTAAMSATFVRSSDPAMQGDFIRLPRLGSTGNFRELLQRYPIHETVLLLPSHDSAETREVLETCDYVGAPVRLVPELLLTSSTKNLIVFDDRGDHPTTPGILLAPRALKAQALRVKRFLDLTLSAVGLVVLSPVLAMVAVLVRLASPGPILYRYSMVGQNGKQFVGYKFRTMIPNANALKRELWQKNEMTGPVFKMRRDPRVTPIGRWLRKYSLDELPQLYSVLKGDLSLVGPRPAGPDEFERFEFWHLRKVSVRPGITCLWQIRGRNKISNFDEWVKMDLEYIDTWSLWLDFKILVRTVLIVFKGTGR